MEINKFCRILSRIADLEAQIYRTAAEAISKGDFLKMAASNIEDTAKGKIEKLKEDAINRYNEEEEKVLD